MWIPTGVTMFDIKTGNTKYHSKRANNQAYRLNHLRFFVVVVAPFSMVKKVQLIPAVRMSVRKTEKWKKNSLNNHRWTLPSIPSVHREYAIWPATLLCYLVWVWHVHWTYVQFGFSLKILHVTRLIHTDIMLIAGVKIIPHCFEIASINVGLLRWEFHFRTSVQGLRRAHTHTHCRIE